MGIMGDLCDPYSFNISLTYTAITKPVSFAAIKLTLISTALSAERNPEVSYT